MCVCLLVWNWLNFLIMNKTIFCLFVFCFLGIPWPRATQLVSLSTATHFVTVPAPWWMHPEVYGFVSSWPWVGGWLWQDGLCSCTGLGPAPMLAPMEWHEFSSASPHCAGYSENSHPVPAIWGCQVPGYQRSCGAVQTCKHVVSQTKHPTTAPHPCQTQDRGRTTSPHMWSLMLWVIAAWGLLFHKLLCLVNRWCQRETLCWVTGFQGLD